MASQSISSAGQGASQGPTKAAPTITNSTTAQPLDSFVRSSALRMANARVQPRVAEVHEEIERQH